MHTMTTLSIAQTMPPELLELIFESTFAEAAQPLAPEGPEMVDRHRLRDLEPEKTEARLVLYPCLTVCRSWYTWVLMLDCLTGEPSSNASSLRCVHHPEPADCLVAHFEWTAPQ